MIFNNSKFNSEWPIKTLNELGTFNRGKSKHRPRNDLRLFENGTYPLVQTGEVKGANILIDSHSNTYNEFGLAQSKLWPAGTLCITIAANIAETALLGYPMCFPDSIVGFNANQDECSEVFMHYIFSYIRSAIQSRIQGSIQDNINIEYLTNLKFRIPKKEEREQIEKTLFELDTKIELNNHINAELEAMAKTIYDYWFVQFDFPISKELATQMGKPELEGRPYKSSGGKMVYNKELKREVPEGWEVKELGNELEVQRGISYKSSEIKGEGIPMINLNSFNLDGTYKADGVKMFSGKYSDSKLIQAGDLLIAVTDVTRNADIIGKAIIVPEYYDELVCSMDVAKVIPSSKLTESYVMMLFNTKHYHNYIKWFASGTIVLHLNLDGMKWYKAELPPSDLLKKFDEIYLPIAKRISETTLQNQELASLRDWLLPMLMNGQVKVGEAKEYVQEENVGMAAERQSKYEVKG